MVKVRTSSTTPHSAFTADFGALLPPMVPVSPLIGFPDGWARGEDGELLSAR